MQHLEACLLIAEADSVLCHLVMFFYRPQGAWQRGLEPSLHDCPS